MTKSTGVGRGSRPITQVDGNGRVCTMCLTYKPWEDFYANTKSPNGRTARCRACIDGDQVDRGREYVLTVKRQVMDAYGRVCVCCGEKELAFLTIDHVNGDGAAHRKATGTRGGIHFYKWLIREGYPKGFQVLCANCNLGRHVNGGHCPHQMRGARRR